MVASAEPSARLRLVCIRFRSAARTAAMLSGRSTSSAIMPSTAAGADAASTADWMLGDSTLARPTTPEEATSNAKLAHATSAAAAMPVGFGTDRQEVVAMPHRLHENEHCVQRERATPAKTSCPGSRPARARWW